MKTATKTKISASGRLITTAKKNGKLVSYKEFNTAMVTDGFVTRTKKGEIPGGLVGVYAAKKNLDVLGLDADFDAWISNNPTIGKARHAEALSQYKIKAEAVKEKETKETETTEEAKTLDTQLADLIAKSDISQDKRDLIALILAK